MMDIWIDPRHAGGIEPGGRVFDDYKGGRRTNWGLPRVNMLCCYGILVECPQEEAHPKAEMQVIPIPDKRRFTVDTSWLLEPIKVRAVYFRMHWVGHPGC